MKDALKENQLAAANDRLRQAARRIAEANIELIAAEREHREAIEAVERAEKIVEAE